MGINTRVKISLRGETWVCNSETVKLLYNSSLLNFLSLTKSIAFRLGVHILGFQAVIETKKW